MMIVLRDIKGNELKLSHGSDFSFKDVQMGRKELREIGLYKRISSLRITRYGYPWLFAIIQ